MGYIIHVHTWRTYGGRGPLTASCWTLFDAFFGYSESGKGVVGVRRYPGLWWRTDETRGTRGTRLFAAWSPIDSNERVARSIIIIIDKTGFP